jgi:NAD(P)-dependent dehydrogenase (short-subunit alcohol dehydrogenase family)
MRSDEGCKSRRPGTAEEIARLVAAILSEDIPFLTGETIYVDG